MVLVTAGLGSLGWSALLPGSAGAAGKPCVGVVVDARLLGGEVRTGCASGDPDSGLEAMTMAGFRYAFVPRQPGLVCQVDQVPECSRHGTTTYWSYWYRLEGSRTWVYSSVGAASRDPAPGSTEAWVWQDGGRREPPDVSLTSICPQLAAAAKTPARTPAPTRIPDTSPSAVRSSAGSTAESPPRRTTGEATPTTQPTPTSSDAPAGSTGAAPGDGAPADTTPDGTPWVGLALGGGLVAALGAAALARSRRSGGTP